MLEDMHNKNPKLISTKEADEWLRLNNVSLSTTESSGKQRCLHIGTIQQPATGNLTCFYARIVDSKFPEVFRSDQSLEHKPVIFCVNKTAHVYVVLCHPKVSDTTVFEYIGKYIINPAIFERQDELIARDILMATYGDNAGIESSQPDAPTTLDEGMNIYL